MASKKSKGKYEADLVKTYHQISGKPKKPGKKVFTIALIGVVATCIVAAAALGVYLYFFSGVTPGLIMNNVSVLDVNLGGMSREDAVSALQTAFDEQYTKETMSVTIQDQRTEISADDIGMTLDTEAAVEAAYGLGRTGTQAKRKLDQAQAALGGMDVDVSDFLHVDDAALQAELEKLTQQFAAQAIDGSWELVGEKPDLTTEEIPVTEQLLKVDLGAYGYEIDMQTLMNQVKEGYATCDFNITYDCKIIEPKAVELDKVYAEVCSEPVEAVMDPETFEVSAHAYGYTFNLENAKALQKERSVGETFEVPFTVVIPTHTKAGLEDILFRDVLGTYTAYSSSDPANRDVNLKLSCQAINGIVLMPGEIFSYNPALGERTPEAGCRLCGQRDPQGIRRRHLSGILLPVSKCPEGRYGNR